MAMRSEDSSLQQYLYRTPLAPGADGNDGTDVNGVSEGATSSDEQQDEDTEGDSTKISDSNDDNDGQSIIKEQADESTTSEDKNTLMETIIEQVNDALSAS
ncbi:MAG: hypothetical protein WA461_05200 [Nitrososphaeraceae archaeon]